MKIASIVCASIVVLGTAGLAGSAALAGMKEGATQEWKAKTKGTQTPAKPEAKPTGNIVLPQGHGRSVPKRNPGDPKSRKAVIEF